MKSTRLIGTLGCGCLITACYGASHRLGGEPQAGAGGESGTLQGGGTGGTTSSGGQSGSSGSATGGTGAQPDAGDSGATVTYDMNPLPDACEVPPGWEDATTRDGAVTFDPVEVLQGYVVNPRAPLPTDDDTVTLFVHSRTETAISGAIVFGSGELPEPATDPLAAYFPRDKYEPGYPGSSWDNLGDAPVWGGYALSLRDGNVEGDRVRFSANVTEQWRTWCELLAGYPSGQCVPSDDVDGYGGTSCGDVWTCPERCDIDGVRYDCGKFVMCAGLSLSSNQVYCACDGCGCTASTTDGALSFDLHLDESGDLEGSVTNQDTDESFAIYLTPQ